MKVTMMRVLSCIFAVCLSVASIARAEDVKIAVIDTQRVLNDSVAGKAARNNLQSQIKKGQERLAQLKADFDKLKADLEKQSAVLSGSALDQRKDALSKKQVEFQRAYQDLQYELRRNNDAEISKVVKEIDAVVKKFANDNGYTFVFEKDKQAVLYASSRVDITDQIIQTLDKKKVDL